VPQPARCHLLAAYAALREVRQQQPTSGMIAGDPAATSQAILTLVDAANPPLRLILGAARLELVRATYEQRLRTWEQWDDVSRAAQGK
jgi:hypothetical protein